MTSYFPHNLVSTNDMPLDSWKYVSVTVDAESGKIKIFEDGNMTATHSFS